MTTIPTLFVYFLYDHIPTRGVARIIEQGFPEERSSAKGALAPPTRGVWWHAPPRKFCKNGFCEVVSSGFRQLKGSFLGETI